jgi:parallel beta-helix repeat protein
VSRSSSARIITNTISNNIGGHGVIVFRVSHADISNNTIDGNGIDGIRVQDNSGVNLGRDTGTNPDELPNNTTANNTGFGIRCFRGGYADGRLGTLNGASGDKDFNDSTCVDSLIP